MVAKIMVLASWPLVLLGVFDKNAFMLLLHICIFFKFVGLLSIFGFRWVHFWILIDVGEEVEEWLLKVVVMIRTLELDDDDSDHCHEWLGRKKWKTIWDESLLKKQHKATRGKNWIREQFLSCIMKYIVKIGGLQPRNLNWLT